MKSSKKRDLTGKRIKYIHVAMEETVVSDMVGLAPRRSYGFIITELVKSAVEQKGKPKTSV